MKQTPLERKTELRRGPGPKRKSAMKRTQPKRDWTEARAKVEREEVCRLGRDGGCEGRLEAAHITGRDRDADPRPPIGMAFPKLWQPYKVHPDRIVPLCTKHHHAFDAHELDLLGHLTPEEEAQAVLDADGLEAARRRLCPTAYLPVGASQ